MNLNSQITLRELQVLQHLAEGLTTQQIGEKLYLSSETVKTHRSKLLIKLDAKNAFQLGMKAEQMQLLMKTYRRAV